MKTFFLPKSEYTDNPFLKLLHTKKFNGLNFSFWEYGSVISTFEEKGIYFK